MERSVRSALRGMVAVVLVVLVVVATTAAAAAPAGADGPAVTVTPDRVHDGQQVRVAISGFSAGYGSLLECAASATVDPTFASLDAGCHMLAGPYAGGPPPYEDVTVAASFEVFNASRTVDCFTEAGGCAVGVIMGDLPIPGQPFASAFAPITFQPPPSLELSPSSGLLDGQVMALTGAGLVPGGSYLVQHCRSAACEVPGRTVVAGSDGRVSVDVPALQRFTAGGRPIVCRDTCSVLVSPADGGSGSPIGRLPYAMAAGSVAVVPDAGLVDGQQVQVSGHELMAGYAGRSILGFPTGEWSLTQCDAAVLSQLDLVGGLTHCGAAPTTRAVDVPGSSLDEALEVRATLPRILGGTTDCAAGPGACVVGLVRFEQDGSFSAHLVPVALAAPG